MMLIEITESGNALAAVPTPHPRQRTTRVNSLTAFRKAIEQFEGVCLLAARGGVEHARCSRRM